MRSSFHQYLEIVPDHVFFQYTTTIFNMPLSINQFLHDLHFHFQKIFDDFTLFYILKSLKMIQVKNMIMYQRVYCTTRHAKMLGALLVKNEEYVNMSLFDHNGINGYHVTENKKDVLINNRVWKYKSIVLTNYDDCPNLPLHDGQRVAVTHIKLDDCMHFFDIIFFCFLCFDTNCSVQFILKPLFFSFFFFLSFFFFFSFFFSLVCLQCVCISIFGVYLGCFIY